MGVDLPGNRSDLVPAAAARAVRRHVRHPLWPTLLAVAAAGLLIRVLVGAGAGAPAPPWMLPPLLAVVAWVHAARRSHARARTTFWIMAAAAGSGVLVYAAWLRGISPFADAAPGSAGIPLAAYLLLAPHLGLTAGAVAALGPGRIRLLGPAFALEALLLLLAGAAATLRLVVEPTLVAAPGGWSDATVLAGLQTLSLVPVLVAALLVLRRGSVLAPRAALLLLVAALSFAGAVFFSLTELGHAPFTGDDPSAHMWTAGWLVFAASGFAARDVAATAAAMLAGRRVHDALRKLIVPGVALFLAAAVLDLGFGREPRPETVATVGLLGLVLALRTGHVFRLVDRDAEQRRQLAHTRALVDVTHALAGTMELDATLRVISEAARSVFATRAAGIELLSADGHSLETRYVVGLPDDLMGVRFPVDGSFTGWVVRHGEPRTTVDPSRDPYVQRVSLDYLGRSPVAAAPIRFHDEAIGVLYACIREEPFDPEELQLMSALAEQAAIAIENARLFEQVMTLSLTDPLTGLANRREMERVLEREFAAAQRGRDLAAALFDLDDFKAYNDTHGHMAGDAALRAFARALQAETRAMNLAARYGGDEFVALLAGAGEEGVHAFVARVRIRFTAAVESLGNGDLTFSVGLAAYRDDMELPDTLIREADVDLYRAKTRVRT